MAEAVVTRVMGRASDWPVAHEAAALLDQLHVACKDALAAQVARDADALQACLREG